MGMRSTPDAVVAVTSCETRIPPSENSTSPADASRPPSQEVAVPCGSRSMTRTRWPRSANTPARLTTVVVLPLPPLLFESVTVRISASRVHSPHHSAEEVVGRRRDVPRDGRWSRRRYLGRTGDGLSANLIRPVRDSQRRPAGTALAAAGEFARGASGGLGGLAESVTSTGAASRRAGRPRGAGVTVSDAARKASRSSASDIGDRECRSKVPSGPADRGTSLPKTPAIAARARAAGAAPPWPVTVPADFRL